MKRVLALLLSAMLVLSSVGTAVAVEPPDDTQPTEGGFFYQVKDGRAKPLPRGDAAPMTTTPPQEEGAFFYSVTAADLEAANPGIQSRAAVGEYFGEQLETRFEKDFYDAFVTYLEGVVSEGGISLLRSGVYTNGLESNGDALNAQILNVYNAILKDHPDMLYWLDKTGETSFQGARVGENVEVVAFFPVITEYQGEKAGTFLRMDYYDILKNRGDGQVATAQNKVDEILASVAGKSDYEKIKEFNKQICLLTDYDFEATEPGSPYDDSFQWVSVFLREKVVCEGYAKAFKYLCDQADIGCLLVEGTSGSGNNRGNHMWNYVELDDKWYLVDCTNNDDTGSNYTETQLAIGRNNSAYDRIGYNPDVMIDGDGNDFPTSTNPAIELLEQADYTPGATPPVPGEHRITVAAGGTADKVNAKKDDVVTVTATRTEDTFINWTSTSDKVQFQDSGARETTFVMPDEAVTITPNYKAQYTITVGAGGSADKAKAEAGAVITLTATRTGTFESWTSSSNKVQFLDSNARQTTFMMPDENVRITPNYVRDSGGTGGGGGGGSSSSSTTSTSASTAEKTYTVAEVSTKTTDAVNKAIEKSLADGSKSGNATIVLENPKSLTPELLKAILDTAEKLSKEKGVTISPMLAIDTVKDGKVVSRIYIDPAKFPLTSEMPLGLKLENPALSTLFEKYYANSCKILTFEKNGAFVAPVTVAVKLDLTGLDTKTLVFYNYDGQSNTFSRIEKPDYRVDENGYLYLTTESGGSVLITDKPMTAK